MLSNKHKYTVLRVSRLLVAPIYTILSFFLKKNDNVVITASLNMEYSDNAKALFEMLVHKGEYKGRVFFVINNEKRKRYLNEQYPGCFISNTCFKDAIFILRARYWFCSAMELPVAVFFQRHIRRVVHLGHGMLYKKIGLIETQVSWYKKLYYALVCSSFTYTIATTTFCRKDIANGFGMPIDRVLLTPQPKTASIATPMPIADVVLSDRSYTHVLYAPTWRPYAPVELFPFSDFDLNVLSDFLERNQVHVWLRVHPRFEQEIKPGLLSSPHVHLFSASHYLDINSYLNYFDVLITDYSSIYYDYLTLQRPILFFDYDFEKYNQVSGVIDEYEKVKVVKTTESMDHFMNQILSIKQGSYDLDAVKRVNEIVNYPIETSKISSVVIKKLLS